MTSEEEIATPSPAPEAWASKVGEVIAKTRELVAKCAESGFTDEADVRALFENNWALTQALASPPAPPADGWREISTAPNQRERVWVVGGRYATPEIVLADGDWWRWGADTGSKATPTHWHPEILPPAPPNAPATAPGSNTADGRES